MGRSALGGGVWRAIGFEYVYMALLADEMCIAVEERAKSGCIRADGMGCCTGSVGVSLGSVGEGHDSRCLHRNVWLDMNTWSILSAK